MEMTLECQKIAIFVYNICGFHVSAMIVSGYVYQLYILCDRAQHHGREASVGELVSKEDLYYDTCLVSLL